MRARRLSSSERYPRIDLIFFDFGGGHRASAMAFKQVAEQQQRRWQIRMVNLREVLEPMDTLYRVTGLQMESVYNWLIGSGLTIGTPTILRATHRVIRALHRRQVELLRSYWLGSRPDLVVSMIPHFNRGIFEGLRAADAVGGGEPTPMVTVLTDLADCPPHFWIEQQDQYVICGTEAAADQAQTLGYRRERVLRTSGMIVRPEFYQSLNINREQERHRLGLRPELPTGLVMFGGAGSRRMVTIAKRIAEAGLETQIIFVCGHNQRLRAQLSSLTLPFPRYIEGFTREIAYLMRLSDFFIGKPGPGSVSEALVMGLPVIVERNARTMVQERYNTEWISQNNLGVVLPSLGRIERGIAMMLDPTRMSEFRASIAKFRNRAVFEIPDIVENLVAGSSQRESAAAMLPQREPPGFGPEIPGVRWPGRLRTT